MRRASARAARPTAAVPNRRSPRRSSARTLDPHLVAALAPQSLAAEQYRSLRTRIKRAENGRALRAIVDHQPEQGRRQEPDRREPRADDGAGVPAARAARRRRPAAAVACTGCSASPDGPGLADVLMGAAELDDALVDAARASPDGAARRRCRRAIRRSCSGRRRCAACSTRCARASIASSSTCRRWRRWPTCTSSRRWSTAC